MDGDRDPGDERTAGSQLMRAAAARGIEFLGRFESDPMAEYLEAAIDAFTEAVTAAGDDADPIWLYGLGIALSYHTDPELPGWRDEARCAVHWLTAALLAEPDDLATAGNLVGEICELHWLCYLADSADDEAVAFTRLLTALDEVPAVADGSIGEHLPDLLRGLARSRRFDNGGDPTELMTAIELLESALPRLPDDLAALADGWQELALACRQAQQLNPSQRWLDGAVTAAAAATAVASSRGERRPELYELEGFCREVRWEQASSPQRHDLVRAIECLAAAVREGAVPDHYLCYCLGDLLRQRGCADRSRADLAEAIDLLGRAVTLLSDADQPEADQLDTLGLYQYGLAQALAADEELDPATADLAAQADAWAVMAQLGVLTDEEQTEALCRWLGAVGRWVEREPAAAAPAARAALTAAWRDIDRLAAGDADLGARLATGILCVTMNLLGTGGLEFVPDRLQQLVRYTQAGGPDFLPAAGLGEALVDLVNWVHGDADPEKSPFGLLELDQVQSEYAAGMARSLALVYVSKGLHSGNRSMVQAGRAVIARCSATQTVDEALENALIISYTDLVLTTRSDSTMPELRSRLTRTIEISDQLVQRGRESPFAAGLVGLASAAGLPPPQLPSQAGVGSNELTRGARDAGHLMQLGCDLIVACDKDDLPAIRRILDQLEAFDREVSPSLAVRLRAMVSTSLAVCAGKHGREQPELAEAAVSWAERGVANLSGPAHPLWSTLTQNLAIGLRLLDRDRVRSRNLGLESLRGQVWRALLQSNTEDAIAVAETAAEAADQVAGWCADDGATEDLVQALETGRGLVLHAATTDRSVTDQLRLIGADELAREWIESGGAGPVPLADLFDGEPIEVPPDLRRRVLRRLRETGMGPLLDPPSRDRIAEALCREQLDALIYLVPASEAHGGMAVMIVPDQPIEVVPLPGLTVYAASPAARYQAACEAAHQSGAGQDWTDQLAAVCDWAWQVAGEWLSQLCATRWAGRIARLALVPVGMLARVPWHAARRRADTSYRYLVEEVAISTLPSARMLCEVSDRPSPAAGTSVFVADPTDNLPAAGAEAQAIHDTYYPDGTLLGVLYSDHRRRIAEAGAGSAEEVLDLIEAGQAAHTLHLACHAISDQADPSRSRLLLAADEELPSRSLLARRRTEPLLLDRIFLSACTTNLSGRDYDEAFSIATAFLAAGARTVFASMWDVPDVDTSALMFMIHHYLVLGCRPVDALHRAQRWMLDPGREMPATMPQMLVYQFGDADFTQPAAWAGFLHLGR